MKKEKKVDKSFIKERITKFTSDFSRAKILPEENGRIY